MVAVRNRAIAKAFAAVSTPIGHAASEQMRLLAREYPPRIERRRKARIGYRTKAWIQPADELAPARPPLIYTRDLDPEGLGYIACQDLSALPAAVLNLPDATGRAVRVACHVRRSRELGPGWFEGLLRFDKTQPMFAARG